MNKWLVFLFFLGFIGVAHATDPSLIKVNSNVHCFVIKLQANPTTGYQWQLVQFDKNLLTLKSSHYQKNKTGLIGSGGVMVFVFTVNKSKRSGSTEILFKYLRSWEPQGSGVVKNVIVDFD